MSDKKGWENLPKWKKAGILAVVAALSIGALFVVNYFIECFVALGDDTLRIPLIVLFGTIAFLAALTISAVALKTFNLANPSQALGLPPGSVRALIALSLILIFALMVIFMANNLGKPTEYTVPVNSTIIYGGMNYTNPDGNTTLLLPPSEAAVDFSKQVLTTVSTLVVALAGFYFGTRSAEGDSQNNQNDQNKG